jgi:hypothetical protein
MSKPVLVKPIDQALPRGMRWQPQTGGLETTGLLDRKLRKDPAARPSVEASASMVLGRAIPLGEVGQETGLVVGYVQSGKTLSFTTVAALARDNHFPLVIIIAGSSIQLAEQSRDRLKTDLGITPDRPRTWALFHNARVDAANNIQRILDEWRDSSVPPAAKQTVLVTVMKQHQNLQHLNDLIAALNLRGISALIIDDEADQASLNNEVPDGTQSTTYQRILDLRSRLLSHTLLQYTATPQAPLLINIIDTLSPNFVEVLDPGADYTGGQQFFGSHNRLVRIIPPNQVPTRTNQLQAPPESLLEALRVFLLGVAAGLMLDGGAGNRSMLVHPSHGTTQHRDFHTWITDIFEEWRRVIRLPANDPDRAELLAAFRIAHEDLQSTEPGIPAFDELIPWLSSAFNRTSIEEVNRRRGKPVIIDWGQQYAWILVGGQAMDRGYTIEGLTVTYMPRGIGTGNADTIQQRARFFGYKRKYLGYCRVYLEAATRRSFKSYVEHEEFMRQQLKAISAKGTPLNDWKRAFVLDPSLRPCRHSVLEFDYVRKLGTSEWYSPNYVVADDATYATNRQLVSDFLATIPLQDDPGHPDRTDIQRHLFADSVSLREAVENLITLYRVRDPIDSQHQIGLLLQLAIALEDNRDEPCSVYYMSRGLRRERGVADTGKIATNLFQGAAPSKPKALQGSVYPGDFNIRANDAVNIQIHNLDLTRDGQPTIENVPVIAVWLPQRLRKPWLVQDQPPQAK